MSSDKKNSSSMWKVIFIILFITNFSYFSWWQSNTPGLGGIYIFILSLIILATIDLIVIISYITTQHPTGIAKVLSYTALSIVLIYVAYIFLGPIIYR
jgi:hypothetical protein